MATLRILAEARSELTHRLNHAADLWIEDKGTTFALHHRGATPFEVRRARVALEEGARQFQPLATCS